MDKNKKLTQLADDMLRRHEQADELRRLGKENPEQASKIESIFAAFAPQSQIVKQKVDVDRFNCVTDLISENIKNSKGYNNFPESEYRLDKKKVFDIKLKHMSVYIKEDKDDLRLVNKIYKKHLNIQSILGKK